MSRDRRGQAPASAATGGAVGVAQWQQRDQVDPVKYQEWLDGQNGKIVPTGLPYVDGGTPCERDPDADGCYLTDAQRERLINVALATGVHSSFSNARDAFTDLRVDLKAQPGENHWGILAEILFGGTIGGPLVVVATRGIERAVGLMAGQLAHHGFDRAALAVAKHGISQVEDAVKLVSKGTRTALKNLAHGASGNGELSGLAEFMREQVKPMTDQAMMGCWNMKDAALVVMATSFLDQERHRVVNYKDAALEVCGRYQDNFLPQIGLESMFRHGEVVWVVDRGGKRQRLFLFRSRGLSQSAAPGEHPGDLRLEREVDADMAPLAARLYKERMGREPDTYNLDDLTVRRSKSWLEEIWANAGVPMPPPPPELGWGAR